MLARPFARGLVGFGKLIGEMFFVEFAIRPTLGIVTKVSLSKPIERAVRAYLINGHVLNRRH